MFISYVDDVGISTFRHVLADVDLDLAMIQVPNALHEEAPLQAKRSQQQVDANAAEAVLLEERHQEPEANENHDVDILKHWRYEKGSQLFVCFSVQ